MLEIQVTSVPEFLRAILPTEPHFPAESWYFRGQGNAAWGLVPSARREKAWEPLGGVERFRLTTQDGLVTSPEEELKGQEDRILHILRQAVEGMGLPTDLSQEDVLRAFAQHIGLPTRLLDWTRSPMIAAYFAAADAITLPQNERLCVYAVSPLYLTRSGRVRHVERLRVPGYGNPNLVAQQGVLFKVEGEPFDLVANLPRRALQAGTKLDETQTCEVENHLAVITLPWSEAPRLLCALRDQGVHAATVYPGQRGIAELVREVLRTSRADA